MDYAPEDPTPPRVLDTSSPHDTLAASDPNYAPPVDDLLKDVPRFPPLPNWNDPELRYMPKTSNEGQPPVTPDDAWRKIHNLVEKYDKGMCESYREQVDTLLVFAGLFSAVVTAFAVESYQWIQDDPADVSAELLRQAVVLLSTLANQTSSPTTSQQRPALPDSVAVRINVYWFLSLFLSLSAALIGIVCKQWLREYERDIGQSAQQALAVRQMKFDGLEAWHVGAIVTSVPLLLQLALVLFLIGISELWYLNSTVATVVNITAGLTGAFYLITASAPLLQYIYLSVSSRVRGTTYDKFDLSQPLPGRAFTLPQCPYKSPQAWLVLRICQPVFDWIIFYGYIQRWRHRPDSWLSFDAYWTARRDGECGPAETTTSRALTWTARALGETHLNSWRVLCARQHLSHAGDSMPYRSQEAEDMLPYLLPSLLKAVDNVYDQARLSKQARLFSHSCQHDLDVNTSAELFLQLARDAPFDPKWFSMGLGWIHAGRSVALVKPILNDDMATELLRVVRDYLSSDPTGLQNVGSVSPMIQRTVALLDWAPSRTRILPALCAVALRFLQSSTAAAYTPRHRAYDARCFLKSLIECDLPYSIQIHQLRGFGHIVALAQFMLDNDPTRMYDDYAVHILHRLGIRYLYDQRVHRSDELTMRFDTLPEHANIQPTPDVQRPPVLTRSAVTYERLPQVPDRLDEDDMRSGTNTVSEHAEAHLSPDVQLPPITRSAVVSTAVNSALVDDTRLPETEISTYAAAADRGCGDEFAAPHLDLPLRRGVRTFGVSAPGRVSRLVSESAIELHNMPVRAGDTDESTCTDPLLGLQQQNPSGGGSGINDTSDPPHIAVPIGSPKPMGASLSGPDL